VIDASSLRLPPWACVTDKRRAHIARVTALLDQWADVLGLADDERTAWHDAGQWHDALRDASEAELRETSGDAEHPVTMLHGPAAAARLQREGESRTEVLDAIRWHTLGNANWSRTGRALYMADFLEPGRPFSREDRAFLAAHVPDDFDGVFRQVVRARIEWTVREGKLLYPETAALWNDVR
jgi:2-amino-4-hydroxy-6-hydroxymethyldihydropteridine diphosphokinase